MSEHYQLKKTIKIHFKKYKKVKVLYIEKDLLEKNLKWEESRNNIKFPHFYGILKLSHIKKIIEIDLKVINNYKFN